MILLFGSPRSGTTWIGKVFDSHPGTLYRHEPDSAVPATTIPLYPGIEDLAGHHDPIVEYVDRILDVRTPKVSGKLPLFPKDYLGPVTRRMRDASVLAAKLSERANLRFPIGDFVARSDDRARIVWKSIESSGRLGALARVFPEARAVHIVRHPCGTIASVLRGETVGGFSATSAASEDYGIIEMLLETAPARERGLDLARMRSLRPEERLAWIWALTNEKVMRDIEGLPNCLTVRYEDVCADPEAGYRRLFEFCGLDWNPQTDAFVRASTSREQTQFHSVFKNPARSAAKWKKELPGNVVQRIRRVVEDTLPGGLFEDDAAVPVTEV